MNKLNTTVCIAALWAGTGAMADVTAEQVWESWKTNLEDGANSTLTIGNEDIGNGVVTITGLAVSTMDEGGSFSANLGTVTFTEQGDGTVAVVMDDRFPIEIQSPDAETVTIEVTQSGFLMIVSGDAQTKSYDVSVDRYAISFVEIAENGAPVFDGDILIALNNLSGTFGTVEGDMLDVSYDFNIGFIDFLADISEPGGEGDVLVSGKIENVASASLISAPLDIDDPDEMFMNGFAFEANYQFGAANFIFDIQDDGSSSVGSVALESGSTAIDMTADQIDYAMNAKTVAVNVESNELPLPVTVNLSELGTGLSMPLSITEAPADFSMTVKLSDFTANDEIWDLGDPGRVLARDPITLDLDFGGKTILLFDILDPAQDAARERADAPGELHAFDINNLLVSAAGAMLTGTGAFTFDNDDLTTFDGIPRPLGSATFGLTGGNALIDNLVGMGLLGADEASMGRMMMGMFARSVGDDELQTTVEVNDQGHLIVNGQRMQ